MRKSRTREVMTSGMKDEISAWSRDMDRVVLGKEENHLEKHPW